jgi:hypothetical protein
MKNQIGDLAAVFEMFGYDALYRIGIFAAIPDAFGIHHRQRSLILAGDHAMGAGALDAQLRPRIDGLAKDAEHGFGTHPVFGTTRAGTHEDVSGVGSHKLFFGGLQLLMR